MQVIDGIENAAFPRSVLTIGNFDGVHRGHREILATARGHAGPLDVPVVALTFEPHPLRVLRLETAPQRLTTATQKQQLLHEAGADVIVVMAATREFLQVEPADFVSEVIVPRFHPVHLVEGPGFGFGHRRRGNVDLLAQLATANDYTLHVVKPVLQDLPDGTTERVSSSLIRQLVSEGTIAAANQALGRPYRLDGIVVAGARRGRELGFPTANLWVEGQLVPAEGVYAGQLLHQQSAWPAAISIGTTPTFAGQQRQIEAHALGFSGDLYDEPVGFDFVQRLRGQRQFASINDLVTQVRADIQAVREMQP